MRLHINGYDAFLEFCLDDNNTYKKYIKNFNYVILFNIVHCYDKFFQGWRELSEVEIKEDCGIRYIDIVKRFPIEDHIIKIYNGEVNDCHENKNQNCTNDVKVARLLASGGIQPSFEEIDPCYRENDYQRLWRIIFRDRTFGPMRSMIEQLKQSSRYTLINYNNKQSYYVKQYDFTKACYLLGESFGFDPTEEGIKMVNFIHVNDYLRKNLSINSRMNFFSRRYFNKILWLLYDEENQQHIKRKMNSSILQFIRSIRGHTTKWNTSTRQITGRSSIDHNKNYTINELNLEAGEKKLLMDIYSSILENLDMVVKNERVFKCFSEEIFRLCV